jgi:hypothetical protein
MNYEHIVQDGKGVVALFCESESCMFVGNLRASFKGHPKMLLEVSLAALFKRVNPNASDVFVLTP